MPFHFSRSDDVEVAPQGVAAIKLRTLIQRSGLTKSAYARHVMRCDPRTLRRWLSGERPMQPRTLAWIDAQTLTLRKFRKEYQELKPAWTLTNGHTPP